MIQRHFAAAFAAATVAACIVPAPAPHGPAPGALAEQEPVGFLLERAQYLGIADSMIERLARLNLRLYSRNRPLQVQIDTLIARPGQRASPDAEQRMPPELRAHLDSLAAQIRANNIAARDTAWSMLTDRQRQRADSMLAAARAPAEERRAPPAGVPQP